MMKKFLAFAMLAMALALIFSACSGGGASAEKIAIEFDLGGIEVENPEVFASMILSEGDKVPEPPDPIDIDGREFLGWSEWDAETAGKWRKQIAFKFDAPVYWDTTIYAYWEVQNAVTFNLGGVVVANPSDYAPLSLKVGETVSQPPDPSNSSRDFLGWSEQEQALGEAWDEDLAYEFGGAVSGSITLYAWWKIKEGIVTFTVTFVHNNGTAATTAQQVVGGEKATAPADVTLAGHVLEFWHLGTFNEATTAAYNFDTPVTANITLTARWKEGNDWTAGWKWSTSDDSKLNGSTNGGYGKQTVFAPGGASKIDNAVERDDGFMPFEKTELIDGVMTTIFNFTGVTKVTQANRAANSGARFPMVGWEAEPDAEMLAKLKTAYSYSFYVRLNSSRSVVGNKTNTWAYLTSVVTVFPREQGYDYIHVFGDHEGDNFAFGWNYTELKSVGTWHKVTVILDANDVNFNMDQAKWMTVYPEVPDERGDFHQSEARKIQWQIPLQHQDGAQRNGDPYDRVTGEHEFNLDFYGLELQMTK